MDRSNPSSGKQWISQAVTPGAKYYKKVEQPLNQSSNKETRFLENQFTLNAVCPTGSNSAIGINFLMMVSTEEPVAAGIVISSDFRSSLRSKPTGSDILTPWMKPKSRKMTSESILALHPAAQGLILCVPDRNVFS